MIGERALGPGGLCRRAADARPGPRARLILADSTTCDPGDADIERLLETGTFFWLDLPRPGAEGIQLLLDVFRFHELAVEDAQDFGRRPKIEDYDGFVLLVA